MNRTSFVPITLGHIALGMAAVLAMSSSAAAQVGHVPNTWEVYAKDSNQIERQTLVRLADLDLTSAAGVQTLYERIVVAASAVCGGAKSAYSDLSVKQYSACRAKATADAVARMKLPTLTRLAAHPGAAAQGGGA